MAGHAASPPVRRFAPSPARRRGMLLVLGAVLILLLLGVAAFVVDLGIAKVTQRTMQTATDAGAIEGLRQRDNPFVDPRASAALVVRQTFDDDWNLGSDPIGFGAGPTVNLVPDATTDLQFGPLIAGTGVYKPVPELNDGTVNAPANRPEGDMLTGNYDASQRHDEGYAANPYERDDFPSGFAGTDGNSFLMRLRRTADYQVPDWNNIAGVSSSGPELPLLFSRALFLNPDGGPYNPREHGLSFRAVSIADAQPALSVGPDNPAIAVEGLAPYALHADYWNALPVGVWSNAQVLATGEIVGVDVVAGARDGQLVRRTQLALAAAAVDTVLTMDFSDGFPAPPFQARIGGEVMLVTAVDGGLDEWTVVRGIGGTAAAAHGVDSMVLLHEVATLGNPIENALPAENGFVVPTVTEYVPIFGTPADATERIVGFGAAQLRPTLPVAPPLSYPVDVQVMRMDSMIPPRNAMAHLAEPVDSALTDAEVNALFAARQAVDGPLRAPALVRSYGQ